MDGLRERDRLSSGEAALEPQRQPTPCPDEDVPADPDRLLAEAELAIEVGQRVRPADPDGFAAVQLDPLHRRLIDGELLEAHFARRAELGQQHRAAVRAQDHGPDRVAEHVDAAGPLAVERRQHESEAQRVLGFRV
jgi:hypothetical protein